MRIERMTTLEHPLYERAMELYRGSFPPHELREEPSQQKILNDPAYHFDLLFDGGQFVGEVLYWEIAGFFYIEHFCILPELRNRHYGQAALELLHGTPLILEIDPPVDAISIRRKGFYERCGFVPNPYRHIHPPYHRGNSGHELVVMSYPAPLTQEQYDAFYHGLTDMVMKDVF